MEELESQLEQLFGHTSFRGVQRPVIQRVLSGRHALLVMPTGGGKSLCYQLPAALVSGRAAIAQALYRNSPKPSLTLVLSPLIALMKDQVDRLNEKRVEATFVNSSLTKQQRLERYAQIREGRYTLLYVTPERFRKPDFLELIASREIALLAVDEAHCISQWGHDFRPDYSRVGEFRELIGNPTTLALTATATQEVQLDIAKQLNLGKLSRDESADCQLFHTGIARPNLHLGVEEVWGVEEKLALILRELERWNLTTGASTHNSCTKDATHLVCSGIVYFTLIRTLEEFSHQLRRAGIEHLVYHGDLPRTIRRQAQEEFMHGQGGLVLATNAFGMGIDKEDIRFVIHAEVPASIEAYYQEIGRAGRDGLESNCCLLYDQQDLMTQMEFIRSSNPEADFYQRTFDLIVHNLEQVRAFGYRWLHEKLCHKQKHDRRLSTALVMLDRYGVLEGIDFRNQDSEDSDWSGLRIGQPMPDLLRSQDSLAEKLQRDQRKLFSVVQYVQSPDRIGFLKNYFGDN